MCVGLKISMYSWHINDIIQKWSAYTLASWQFDWTFDFDNVTVHRIINGIDKKGAQKWAGHANGRPTRTEKWVGRGPPGPIGSAAYD